MTLERRRVRPDAGASGRVGGRAALELVVADANDPDYRGILATFQPPLTQLASTPRMDMANAAPAPGVCRDCQ